MFYCDACAELYGWPNTLSKSHGQCECCNATRRCNDAPMRSLPWALKHRRGPLEIEVTGPEETPVPPTVDDGNVEGAMPTLDALNEAWKRYEAAVHDLGLTLPVKWREESRDEYLGYVACGPRFRVCFSPDGSKWKPVLECSSDVRIRMAAAAHFLWMECRKAAVQYPRLIAGAIHQLSHATEIYE